MNSFKKINYLIIPFQSIAILALIMLFIANWSYISNPYQMPNYHESNSIFAYQNDKLVTILGISFYILPFFKAY